MANNASLTTLILSNSGSFADAADNGASLVANNGSTTTVLQLAGVGSSLNNAGSNGVIGSANTNSQLAVILQNTTVTVRAWMPSI